MRHPMPVHSMGILPYIIQGVFTTPATTTYNPQH